MELKDQVCSLELAKKLKELGVKQESYFFWIQVGQSAPELATQQQLDLQDEWEGEVTVLASTFTVAELGEMLPERIAQDDDFLFIECPHHSSPMGYRCWIAKTSGMHPTAIQPNDGEPRLTTEADARTTTLTYLLENNLVTVDQINQSPTK